ncbi:MAG TPA: bifunctional rhamnulose-1-phosphate aldolase/short-chain dehydrogenase, partial [Capsulimonadaceae bacterium]|nr:bifunctional rhamnulose-1-phosphate aldolase/short-chain dehydrogenase [Capsulimonadaceae bacterium]
DGSPLDQLVTMSRLIGAEPELVVWGGGNTSVKLTEPDFRGRETFVLRIKGSGSDLKTIERKHFAGVRMEDVLPLFDRQDMSDEDMVAYLGFALTEPNAPRPSIETLLHAFIPAAAVAHSHADAILALCNNKRGSEVVREALGSDVIQIPYRRPGFLLSKEVGQAVQANPNAAGVVLMNHGLITWGETCKAAYDAHIDLVSRAEAYLAQRAHSALTTTPPPPASVKVPEGRGGSFAPIIRGALSREKRVVLRYDNSPDIMAFVDSPDAARLCQIGACTPDHILSTKFKPLFVPAKEGATVQEFGETFEQALAKWREEYKAYYEAHNTGEPMLEASPRVVLIPSFGMWTTGKDSRAAVVPADIYHHTVGIIGKAEAVAGYKTLSDADAFAAEYWPLELYKLTLAPQEKELARRVAAVTGGAHGLGKAIAELFAEEGAHVAVCDRDKEGAEETAEAINKKSLGRAIAVEMDVTCEDAVRKGFDQVALAFGGLDILVSNAGLAPTGRIENLPLETWEKSLAINATGHFLVAREAVGIFRSQGIGGNIIFNVTKNVLAPGADFGAYSCAKAAEAQLARILAVENGPYGIRVNMLNPDAIFETGLWSQQVKAERAKAQGIATEEMEEFYRKRNLLKTAIHAEDVAQAALWLASDRSAKTTGSIIPIDGGLREAFPR